MLLLFVCLLVCLFVCLANTFNECTCSYALSAFHVFSLQKLFATMFRLSFMNLMFLSFCQKMLLYFSQFLLLVTLSKNSLRCSISVLYKASLMVFQQTKRVLLGNFLFEFLFFNAYFKTNVLGSHYYGYHIED